MSYKLKYIKLALLLLMGSNAFAQITVQSPYSKFGVGNLNGLPLPQQRSMGGISAGLFRSSYMSNINAGNPASYAGIGLTTLDIGLSGDITTLKSGSLSERSFNSTLNHVAMGFPVSSKSALSLGLLPYSELGYNFKNTVSIGGRSFDYVYAGEGGLSKAYLGYGIQFGDHFRIGANAEYLFGNLIQSTSTENADAGSFNSRSQHKNNIGGLTYSYGAQLDFKLDNKTSLVIGYSGSASSSLRSKSSIVNTIYLKNSVGEELSALDTLDHTVNNSSNMKLPLLHNIGFSIYKENKWLFGADYRMGKWSDFRLDGTNQNLTDTYGVSVGGQFTPDVTAINGYFKRVDYRLGFSYDKTYVQINNTDVKQMAFTVGLGLPLSSGYGRSSFYKMNFGAEIGQRGSLTNGLIKENYINFRLGFMLNDRWFQRIKLD